MDGPYHSCPYTDAPGCRLLRSARFVTPAGQYGAAAVHHGITGANRQREGQARRAPSDLSCPPTRLFVANGEVAGCSRGGHEPAGRLLPGRRPRLRSGEHPDWPKSTSPTWRLVDLLWQANVSKPVAGRRRRVEAQLLAHWGPVVHDAPGCTGRPDASNGSCKTPAQLISGSATTRPRSRPC